MIQPVTLNPVASLRDTFESGATRSYAFRKSQLEKLRQSILSHEEQLYEALATDLGKSKEESWVTEIGMVIAEIRVAIKNLRHWMEPERVPTNLLNLPSSSRILREPLGVVLIIAPWNYPFQLLVNPLVGAIAAGNCAVLKPSELAPATEKVTLSIIAEAFDPGYIRCITGDGISVIPQLMDNFRFDHIFFTGGEAAGRSIYRKAADQLVPVTLELGGKSPCVVESDANIKVAGKRIAVTKFSNAGQMCVAPDYLLVHESKKDGLIQSISESIRNFFTENPEEGYGYGRMINTKQFDRVAKYIATGNVVFGGRTDREKLFIEPTMITDVKADDPVMNDEIFGPVLPIIPFTDHDDALQIIRRHPNPLAFYLFTESREKEKRWVDSVSFGGGCINNASWHLTNHHLPFGGRGKSGTGQYHGKFSFDTFSHLKSVMKTPTWFDPSIKYPPFKGKLKIFKWVIR